jgi:pimeloyl-ACP methyl ester carboxylesterase
MEKNPVLFVHGIGASASIWKKVGFPGRNSYYLSFSNRFGHPQNQATELKSEIDRIAGAEGQARVVLVCHSMGGLVARKYLSDHFNDHNVEKLVLLSTPNLGSIGLSFNWLPAIMILVGLLGAPLIWPLFLTLIGVAWELISYFRGVLLLSPAAWAMRPKSGFLRELNNQELPRDVKYVAVLSDTKDLPHRLVNLFFFREGGDGAVPLSSQKLSPRCVPNYMDLDYSELQVSLPHFEIPRRAQAAIAQALQW